MSNICRIPSIIVTKDTGASMETLVDEEVTTFDQGLGSQLQLKALSLALIPNITETDLDNLLKTPNNSNIANSRATIKSPQDGSIAHDAYAIALNEIEELDAILNEKQRYLQALERNGKDLELSNASQPDHLKETVTESISSGEGSVHADSTRLNGLIDVDPDPSITRTPSLKAFLTQPTVHSTQESIPGTLDVIKTEGTNTNFPERIVVPKKKLIPFTPQNSSASLRIPRQFSDSHNFIARNKIVQSSLYIVDFDKNGPEARYYSALTPNEQERVDSILVVDSDEDTADADNNKTGLPDTKDFSKSGAIEPKVELDISVKESWCNDEDHFNSATPVTSSLTNTAYSYEGGDARRMEEIHRKLTELVPPEEWRFKLSTWSLPISGWASPSLSLPSIDLPGRISIGSTTTSDSCRRPIEDELRLMKQLEHELKLLKEQEPVPATKNEIEEVLLQCLKREIKQNQSR